VVFAKKTKLLPGITKSTSDTSTKEKIVILPNCGIG
jgi:hypothetical protein